jgi:hypothetical protein
MNIIGKNDYTFPFDTCEKPRNSFFAQPYSVTINFLSTIIVLYFLWQTHTLHAFILLFSLLLFDLSHTFSHFIHIKSSIQITLVHVLAYILNFAFLYALYKYTNKLPSVALIIFLVFILSFDVYAFFNLSLLYYIFTQIIFFFSIFIYYYGSLSKGMKNKLNILLILIGIIYIGFVNEAFNCKRMLEMYPNFPFHAIIEILILFAVYFFCITFYNI